MIDNSWFNISKPICETPEVESISTTVKSISNKLDLPSEIDVQQNKSLDYTPVVFDYYKELLFTRYPPEVHSNNQLIDLIRKHGTEVYKCSENDRFGSDRVPSIPIISCSHDTLFLKRPCDGEKLCMNGERCEGVAIGVVNGKRNGFTLKPYRLPDSDTSMLYCLLCIRRQVTLEYYELRCRDGRTNKINQPFANIIDCSGEYRKESVIYAEGCGDFHGIIQPIVKYQRYNYKIKPDCIDQSSLYFWQAPRHVGNFTTKLVSMPRSLISKNNVKVKYPNDFPGNRILLGQLYKDKKYDELHEYIISMFDTSTLIKWFTIDDIPDVVNVLSLCHFFSEKANLKSIPIGMLISKVLPFRCQFNKFRQVCTNAVSTSRHSIIFLKMVIWLSLTGSYPYCKYACPPDKCVYLAGIFMTSNICGMNAFITKNMDLTYMALKEFVAYIVQFDDPLHQVLTKHKKWSIFESAIKTTMENARYEWYNNHMTRFNEIISNRSNKSLVGLYNNGIDRFTVLINRYVKEHVNPDINRKDLISKFNSELAYRPFNDTLVALMLIDPSEDMYHVTTTLRVLYNIHHFESNDISIKTVMNRLCVGYGSVMSTVYGMFVLIREALKVQEIVLPIHIRTFHVAALLSKYGIHHYEESVANINDCLYCLRCQDIKGYVMGVTTGKLARRIRTSVGNHCIVYDNHNRSIYCQRKKIKPRTGPQTGPLINPGPVCKDIVCQRVSLMGNLIIMYGHMFMPCFECGTATVFDFSCWFKDKFYCKMCLSEATTCSHLKKECIYCKEEVLPSAEGACVQYVHRNGDIFVANTCTKHRVLKNHRIVDYNHLINVNYTKTMDSMRR